MATGRTATAGLSGELTQARRKNPLDRPLPVHPYTRTPVNQVCRLTDPGYPDA